LEVASESEKDLKIEEESMSGIDDRSPLYKMRMKGLGVISKKAQARLLQAQALKDEVRMIEEQMKDIAVCHYQGILDLADAELDEIHDEGQVMEWLLHGAERELEELRAEAEDGAEDSAFDEEDLEEDLEEDVTYEAMEPAPILQGPPTGFVKLDVFCETYVVVRLWVGPEHRVSELLDLVNRSLKIEDPGAPIITVMESRPLHQP